MPKDATLRDDQRALLRSICGWLLEQDHDDISQEYLWFLTDDQKFDPVDDDQIERVRSLLNELVDVTLA